MESSYKTQWLDNYALLPSYPIGSRNNYGAQLKILRPGSMGRESGQLFTNSDILDLSQKAYMGRGLS